MVRIVSKHFSTKLKGLLIRFLYEQYSIGLNLETFFIFLHFNSDQELTFIRPYSLDQISDSDPVNDLELNHCPVLISDPSTQVVFCMQWLFSNHKL